jgi:NAD+ diphosphatase
MPLADHAIDRAGHRRSDTVYLAQARRAPGTHVLLMSAGEPFATPSGEPARPGAMLPGAKASALTWLGAPAFSLPHTLALFLGLARDGEAVFALDLAPPDAQALTAPGGALHDLGTFLEFRSAVQGLSPFDAGVAATARGLFEWHRLHPFCARCGAPSAPSDAGWKRVCTGCSAEHFPRTDPVAIMRVTQGDTCLLGRQVRWPPGFWSCLAGFIEPGESIEQGAVRELHEEAGIRADPDAARIVFSQPWPFPASLMIGVALEATSTAITLDKAELDDARWFSRAEVSAMLEGTHPDAFCPPPSTIAHHLLRAWVEDKGPGT